MINKYWVSNLQIDQSHSWECCCSSCPWSHGSQHCEHLSSVPGHCSCHLGCTGHRGCSLISGPQWTRSEHIHQLPQHTRDHQCCCTGYSTVVEVAAVAVDTDCTVVVVVEDDRCGQCDQTEQSHHWAVSLSHHCHIGPHSYLAWKVLIFYQTIGSIILLE